MITDQNHSVLVNNHTVWITFPEVEIFVEKWLKVRQIRTKLSNNSTNNFRKAGSEMWLLAKWISEGHCQWKAFCFLSQIYISMSSAKVEVSQRWKCVFRVDERKKHQGPDSSGVLLTVRTRVCVCAFQSERFHFEQPVFDLL